MAEQSILAGRRLLVVEDDYFIAVDLVQALEEHGAEIVGMASTVADALAVIEAHGKRLHAAVLDVNLGQERVYPVADALFAQGTPFVFATGYDLWVIPERYSTVPRCEKPVDVRALARLLQSRTAG